MSLRMMLCCLLFVFSVRSSLDLFATFNSIGITKTTSNNLCNNVTYCSDGHCETGHPLSYVKRHNYFVGSIMWLQNDTEYNVTVDCEGDIEENTTCTRKELQEHVTPVKTLYVSPEGTGNNCLELDPCQVSLVDGLLEPGTHVLFEDGIYKIGDLYIRNGGTSSQPVVFRKKDENGEVIIDGSSTLPNEDFVRNGNVYEASVSIGANKMRFMAMVNKVTGETRRMLRYYDLNQLGALYYENYGYHALENPTTVTINIGNLRLNDYNFVYTDRSFAFTFLQSDYYHIFGLHFRYFGNDYCVRFNEASNCWLRNNTIEHCYRCIGLSGKSDHNLIEENEFFDSMFKMSPYKLYPSAAWNGIKAVGTMEAGSIIIFSTGTSELAGRGLVVRRNIFHDWFDSFNIASAMNSLVNVTNEIDVHDNLIYRCGDDGFQIDGLASNIRAYNNYVEDILTGISVAPAVVGPVYIVNNVFKNCVGVCYKYNVDDPDETGPILMYHNIAIQREDSTRANMNIANHFWQLAKSRNNILLSQHYCWRVAPDNDEMNVDLDYDACYTDESYYDLIVKWENGTGSYSWSTLSEFQGNTGQEMHGIHITDENDMVNLFNNTGVLRERFKLKGSLLKGKGESIPGINVNNQVGSPDIGLMFHMISGQVHQPPIPKYPDPAYNLPDVDGVIRCSTVSIVVVVLLMGFVLML